MLLVYCFSWTSQPPECARVLQLGFGSPCLAHNMMETSKRKRNHRYTLRIRAARGIAPKQTMLITQESTDSVAQMI